MCNARPKYDFVIRGLSFWYFLHQTQASEESIPGRGVSAWLWIKFQREKDWVANINRRLFLTIKSKWCSCKFDHWVIITHDGKFRIAAMYLKTLNCVCQWVLAEICSAKFSSMTHFILLEKKGVNCIHKAPLRDQMCQPLIGRWQSCYQEKWKACSRFAWCLFNALCTLRCLHDHYASEKLNGLSVGKAIGNPINSFYTGHAWLCKH